MTEKPMTAHPNRHPSWQLSLRHNAFKPRRLEHAVVFTIDTPGTSPTQIQNCLVTAWPFAHLMIATDVRGGNLSGTIPQ